MHISHGGPHANSCRILAGANTDYNIYLELKPDQPEALLSRATVRYQLGLYEQSKEDFLKLLTLPVGETQTIFYNQSASASGANQIMTAQGAIKPQIFNYLGLVETKLGHYKEAITWLDSAIALRRKEADYYVNRGIAKEGMNDPTAHARLRDRYFTTAGPCDGASQHCCLEAKNGRSCRQ